MYEAVAGPSGSITDVDGIKVGEKIKPLPVAFGYRSQRRLPPKSAQKRQDKGGCGRWFQRARGAPQSG